MPRRPARGGPLAGLGVGVMGGLAYLTRPEALVVLGGAALGLLVLPRPEARRAPARRLLDLGWMLAPGLALVVPYLLAIRAHPVLGGVEGAGSFKLTLKQNLPQILAAASPGAALANAARLLGRVGEVLAPALPLVALAAWARAPRVGPLGPARRLRLQLVAIGAPLLLAFAVVRPDPRFGNQLALLLVPAAGAWLARGLRAWTRRGGRAWAPALALVLVCLPIALRDRHERKATYRDVGQALALERARRVLSADSRAAYYAGAQAVWLPPHLRADAAAIVSLAASEGVDAIVLVARTSEQEATSRAVGALLGGRTPRRLERPGAETLHVFSTR